jgi:multicomponent Na+:H+ antiporter subunit F
VHTPIFNLAIVWLGVLLVVIILQVLRHRQALEAVLAVAASTLVLIAALVIYTVHTGVSYYLDPALVVALLSFVETVVVARLLSHGGVFR